MIGLHNITNSDNPRSVHNLQLQFFLATLCCIGVYNLFTMYYGGLLQENWETRCGYVYAVTITNMVTCYTSIKTQRS